MPGFHVAMTSDEGLMRTRTFALPSTSAGSTKR
jgi:hypothetical protein